ncbi:ABC-type transport system involved in resistance to organic solvents periplasmic component [Prochlorococcus marinus str. NATL2A]|uniref:ABC-type transport system involved in resistance to organic solvents periplasmic component n=1 Tax=Prochlorococcus marinus (strain NATL2A) TaxID=59920 RepID=Q46H85_PROMT|nr:MlaD family protein [Prochlorococcus marinus]AAZ59143.1 ABC-type transport system involved in resistance to organic solvents periplasmic component [Prochlorococcus marinus str. NATL2A]
MRRSLRDAFVGFSLLGGLVIFSGAMLWLRDFRLGSKTWEISASFKDASGLAKMSPVTYRGIIVGSVQNISFTPNTVETKIKINNDNLILPKPVIAKIVTSSMLGGDAQLSLISLGKSLNKNELITVNKDCPQKRILCSGDKIKGVEMVSISSLTEGINGIIDEADKQAIVNKVSESIQQFDRTQANLDELVLLSKSELIRAKPIISELTKASFHLNNILESLDNPETLKDIQELASTSSSLTKKIDQMSSDMGNIMEDKELINALKKVTIGLSKLFDDIYP